MKIAVTSVSGKLGASIANELIKEIGKDNVVGIARTPPKAAHLGIEVREGDYNSRDQFNAALKGVDVVLIVSGMGEPSKRIEQHRNVIEAAKLNGLNKIVYTSIVGDEERTAFNPIVKSNRQTEQDVRDSGLNWAIGRNGIYIEPDLEYINQYVKDGGIENCAGEGLCGYTSRTELARAYTKMLLEDRHNGNTYNLTGEGISQSQLAGFINSVYGTNLTYHSVSVSDYEAERKAALGDFLGTVISGIYEGIKIGAQDVESDFEKAAGRPHQSPLEIIKEFKEREGI